VRTPGISREEIVVAPSSAVPRPNLDQLKRQSRELLAALEAGDAEARDRFLRALPKLHGDASRLPGFVPKLADAQLAVARENGFASWPQLKAFADTGEGAPPPFRRAVLAVVNGDIDTLRSLLADDPELIHERSPEPHRAGLLHYIGANGVDNELQRTPPNAVEVCQLLLQAGADPDASCETYGGGPQQTTLNLLVSSVWPHKAGLQADLARVLVESGAAVNGPLGDGAPLRTALDFGYTDTARELARLGARVDALDLAAGLGRTEALAALWQADEARDVGDLASARFHAFVLACRNGQADAAQALVDLGVDIDTCPADAGTGLHEAIAWDRVEVVRALLARGADRTIRHGRWGATALDFASYNGRLRCVEALLADPMPSPGDLAEALVSAADQAHADVARRLLTAGADPTRALQRAREKGLAEIAALLEG
jgi:ankyrin repeat protein